MGVSKGHSDPYGGRSRARFPWLMVLIGVVAYTSVGVYSCLHG